MSTKAPSVPIWKCGIPLFTANSSGESRFLFRPALCKVNGHRAKYHTLKTFIVNNKVYLGWGSFREVEEYVKRQKGDAFKPLKTSDMVYAFGWAHPKDDFGSIRGMPWMQFCAVILKRMPAISEGLAGDWHSVTGDDASGYSISDYLVASPLKTEKPKWERLLDIEEDKLGDLKTRLPIPDGRLIRNIYGVTKIPEGLLLD